MIKRIIFISLIVLSVVIGIFLPKYHVLGMLLMLSGFVGLLYDSVLFKLKLNTEIKEMKDAIDSIVENAEPEVISRSRNIDILVDLKMDVYELSRVLVDDVDFLRHDVLNNLDIPIYVESSDRVFKNKEMKSLCHELKKEPSEFGSEVTVNDVVYKRYQIREGFFYYLPAPKVHSVE